MEEANKIVTSIEKLDVVSISLNIGSKDHQSKQKVVLCAVG